MAVRKLKPTSAGRRFQTVSDFEEITRTTPEKSLTEGLTKKAGRNNHGRVTSRRRGGGVKRLYRIIDFKRNKLDIPATVAHIEYDPNRTARIALLHYADGEKRYILAPLGVKQGDVIVSGEKADIKPGNALPMASSAAPLAPMPSSWPRKASTPCCVCPPVKSARCWLPASPPSARSATSSTRTSPWARLAVIAGSVVVPRFAAWP